MTNLEKKLAKIEKKIKDYIDNPSDEFGPIWIKMIDDRAEIEERIWGIS